jgi:uroporphyrinogen-III synthase
MSMDGKKIAILESRVSEQMAEMVRRHGGIPVSAPALAEIPDIDPVVIAGQIEDWSASPPDMFIFQTGVGTRAFFQAAGGLALKDRVLELLRSATVVVRGPKPTAVLRSLGARIDVSAPSPHTTAEVLAELANMDIGGKHIVVQRYGGANPTLHNALAERGARVTEIATYRWSLPSDTRPLLDLFDALERDEIDAIAFTSASQVTNLFAVARENRRGDALPKWLRRIVVASIGPVCTAALKERAVRVDAEPDPPKLGPFMRVIDEALRGTDRRNS